MASKTFASLVLKFSLLMMIMIFPIASLADDHSSQAGSTASATQLPGPDVRGTWSGTFFSKHSNVAPFTMTVVVGPNPSGHVVGSSTLNSDCVNGAQLEVIVSGPKVVLAGSDSEGDSITVQGTLDSTGTLLKASYILNGSPSGRCETDEGTGNLAKR